MALSEKPSKGPIENFIKKKALPAAAGLLALGLASGCVQTDYIEFPKCKTDSQPRLATGTIVTDSFLHNNDRFLSIEGTVVWTPLGDMPQAEIIPKKPAFVPLLMKPGRFKGGISERIIDVEFGSSKEIGNGIETIVNIKATCDSEAKQNP